jgi:hypothetical protein
LCLRQGLRLGQQRSVVRAAEAALAARKYVSSIDLLVGLGWFDPGALKRWQQGQIIYIEQDVQANPARLSEAMKLFRLGFNGGPTYSRQTGATQFKRIDGAIP